MFTKRTIIGIAVGAAIIGIGAAALATSIGAQSLHVEEVVPVGGSLPYNIKAPAHAAQAMVVEGERFDLELVNDGFLASAALNGRDLAPDPAGAGLSSIPQASYEGSLELEWSHGEDGTTDITIQNTGSTELAVDAALNVSTDPILFAYHFVVITAGVIIIGFSLGFSVRRPKGF